MWLYVKLWSEVPQRSTVNGKISGIRSRAIFNRQLRPSAVDVSRIRRGQPQTSPVRPHFVLLVSADAQIGAWFSRTQQDEAAFSVLRKVGVGI
jgi:hypothetical protein